VTNSNSQRYQEIFWLNSPHREREGFKSIYPALNAPEPSDAIQPRTITYAAFPHVINQSNDGCSSTRKPSWEGKFGMEITLLLTLV
jgi:hypothetical protein